MISRAINLSKIIYKNHLRTFTMNSQSFIISMISYDPETQGLIYSLIDWLKRFINTLNILRIFSVGSGEELYSGHIKGQVVQVSLYIDDIRSGSKDQTVSEDASNAVTDMLKIQIGMQSNS